MIRESIREMLTHNIFTIKMAKFAFIQQRMHIKLSFLGKIESKDHFQNDQMILHNVALKYNSIIDDLEDHQELYNAYLAISQLAAKFNNDDYDSLIEKITKHLSHSSRSEQILRRIFDVMVSMTIIL